MKIAVCDDDSNALRQLCHILDQYKEERNEEITYCCFPNAVQLLDELEEGSSYDVIFLDMIMPGLTGLAAAKEIRQKNTTVRLVFLTVSPEFAVESYTVKAFHYAIKPAYREQIFNILSEIELEIADDDSGFLVVNNRGTIRKVWLKGVEYCESIGRTLYYHMCNGTVYEATGTMQNLEDQLAQFENFAKAHRSYMVNLDHVVSIDCRKVEMESGKCIPMAKLKHAQFRDIYLEHAIARTRQKQIRDRYLSEEPKQKKEEKNG